MVNIPIDFWFLKCALNLFLFFIGDLTKVQKWGNSLALRIPKAFAVDAQLENDSFVEISIVKGKIIVTPVPAPSWTLDELLAGITKNNLHNEVDTGFAVGNEVW